MRRAVPLAEAGYTIVETMIFLIVTGALMVSAVLLFNGKISRSQFTVAVRQFGSTINNTINEVSTGTYNGTPAFTCTSSSVGPASLRKASADTQGSNTGCLFVGKVMHPGYNCKPDDLSRCTDVNVYTVFGNRLAGNGSDVTSLVAAKPVLADSADPDSVDLTDHKLLPNGLFVTGIYALNSDGSLGQSYGAIGFFQTFPQQDQGGQLQSGSQHVQVIPMGGQYPISQDDINKAAFDNKDAPGGLKICLSGGGQASITIGLANSNLTTNVKIGDTACPNI
jgi:type II secretory pathway pseudopilin PulG